MKPKMKPYRNIESREIGKSIYQANTNKKEILCGNINNSRI